MGCLKLSYYETKETKENLFFLEESSIRETPEIFWEVYTKEGNRVKKVLDYSTFGMQMPGRTFSNGEYRYGFNGKENDNEVKGVEGSQQDYGMRISDPRLARFLSVDPLTTGYPELTPYQFASNRPIDGVDLDGLEYAYYDVTISKNGQPKIKISNFDKNDPRNFGKYGQGIMYRFHYSSGKELNYFKARQQKIPVYGRPFSHGQTYADYGNYMGSTSYYVIGKFGRFRPHYDYSVKPIDAVDYAAYRHDRAYDKNNAIGENSLYNDWSVIQIDLDAIESWKKIVELGIGGTDPYIEKPITKTEFVAAQNAISLFELTTGSKKYQISLWMQRNIEGSKTVYSLGDNNFDSENMEFNYQKFRQMYLQQDKDGDWIKIPEMWDSENQPIIR